MFFVRHPLCLRVFFGNFGQAISYFYLHLVLQRDLSDSTVERAFGTAFGHSFLAYISLQKGLSKISINENKIKERILLLFRRRFSLT